MVVDRAYLDSRAVRAHAKGEMKYIADALSVLEDTALKAELALGRLAQLSPEDPNFARVSAFVQVISQAAASAGEILLKCGVEKGSVDRFRRYK